MWHKNLYELMTISRHNGVLFNYLFYGHTRIINNQI